MLKNCFIALGTNLGNRKENILRTYKLINETIGTIIDSSSIYESEPWGYNDSHYYYNSAIKVESVFEIQDLLLACQKIEGQMGRIRQKPGYEPRIIDIDILFYNNLILQYENLIIPHPRLHLRKFVLIPLQEIASDFIHPVLNKPICQLYDECNDTGNVIKVF